MAGIDSRTVLWWPVHDYATQLAATLGVDLADRLPFPGTLPWLALPDNHPVRHAAMLQAASQFVLRIETAQEARAEASKAIAASTDWRQVAREIRQRRTCQARIERKADVA